MKIILFDIIGEKSGCKYYDVVFYKQLVRHRFDAEIHSNFSYLNNAPRIRNIYKGSKLRKVFNLLLFIPHFIVDILKNRRNVFIYMTYGEFIDWLLILFLVTFHPRPMLDVHEFISTDKENSRFYKSLFRLIYRKVALIIYHSERSKRYIDKIGYRGEKLYVPHFKYEFPKQYTIDRLDTTIRNAISPNRINVLFFGHMRKSKGIETVLNSIILAEPKSIEKLHFIFAGDDSHLIVNKKKEIIKERCSLSTILRFIKDEELNFLFDNIDVVLLPYEEVSQSGILETAVYFRKPMILSDVEYFKEFNIEYPSFSYLIRKGNANDIYAVFAKISKEGLMVYKQQDLDKFYQTDVFENFFEELKKMFQYSDKMYSCN